MRQSLTAGEVIDLMGLRPLPIEGGYFRETYRSLLRYARDPLAETLGHERYLATGIYYLLTPDTFSELHALGADEMYHFYLGDPVELVCFDPDGNVERVVLGGDLLRGERPQHVVPEGVWQGSRLIDGGEFALLGTTMSPGFDIADYRRGDREVLSTKFPEWANVVAALTRTDGA